MRLQPGNLGLVFRQLDDKDIVHQVTVGHRLEVAAWPIALQWLDISPKRAVVKQVAKQAIEGRVRTSCAWQAFGHWPLQGAGFSS